LCKQYGCLDKKNNAYTFPDTEKKDIFNQKIKELLETEIIVPIKPISITEIGNENVSPKDLFLLTE